MGTWEVCISYYSSALKACAMQHGFRGSRLPISDCGTQIKGAAAMPKRRAQKGTSNDRASLVSFVVVRRQLLSRV